MIWFIKTGGPLMLVLLLIAAVILVQIVRSAMALFGSDRDAANHIDRGVHAILFWGAFSAVLGVYAQLSGLYRALNAIIRAADVSPQIIAEGIAVSFHTTLFGLSVFLISGLAWFVLYRRHLALSS